MLAYFSECDLYWTVTNEINWETANVSTLERGQPNCDVKSTTYFVTFRMTKQNLIA
jgi:hypothetical protein